MTIENPSIGLQQRLSEAQSLHRGGKLLEARERYQTILKLQPKNSAVLQSLGIVCAQLGELGEAVKYLKRAAKIDPKHPLTLITLADVYYRLGELESAVTNYDAAAALVSGYVAIHLRREARSREKGQHDATKSSSDMARAAKDEYAEICFRRGAALHELGRFEAAVASYNESLAANPNNGRAWNNRGNTLQELRRFDAAIESYDKAIAHAPNNAEAFCNRGIALQELGRAEDAIASYDMAIAVDAKLSEAFSHRGSALQKLRMFDAALASYEAAIALKPGYADAHNNRGTALHEMRRFEEALASYDAAVAADPSHAEAFSNRGASLEALKDFEGAIASYDTAISIKSDIPWVRGSRLFAKLSICDWSDPQRELAALPKAIEKRERVADPFKVTIMLDSPSLQHRAATLYARERHPENRLLGELARASTGPKVRIGYFSADFHDHPTAYLTAELFELHDRERFEVVGFSFGPQREDAMRRRLAAAFDAFHDVHTMSDRDIAILSRAEGVDIAVDLNGLTKGGRTDIFAHRAAPVQVSYLGYPGTTGCSYIDYLIADKVVVPDGDEAYYSEKIAFLPNSYQVNDRKRSAAETKLAREDAGLPPQGFVFCCFNNSFKIMPETFERWMRILKRVDGSILWLLGDKPSAVHNLRHSASRHGVQETRLVFADFVTVERHLARYRLADLFLDTLPYNAHTTASDALWMGLPVLTLAGRSFAGRVAASLLRAVDLPELIAESSAAYEQLAVEFATDAGKLASTKAKLIGNRDAAALFDTHRFTRDVEEVYLRMHRRYQDGLPPESIHVGHEHGGRWLGD